MPNSKKTPQSRGVYTGENIEHKHRQSLQKMCHCCHQRQTFTTIWQHCITNWWTQAGQCGQVGTTLLNIDDIVYRVDHVTARRLRFKDIDVEQSRATRKTCAIQIQSYRHYFERGLSFTTSVWHFAYVSVYLMITPNALTDCHDLLH